MLSHANRRLVRELSRAGVDGENGYPLEYAVFDALEYARELLGGRIVYAGRFEFLDRGGDHLPTVLYDWRKHRLYIDRSVAELKVREQQFD